MLINFLVYSVKMKIYVNNIRGLSKKFVDTCNFILNNDAIFRKVLKYFNIDYNNACV